MLAQINVLLLNIAETKTACTNYLLRCFVFVFMLIKSIVQNKINYKED
jgi:hypothetical protein